MMCMKKSKVLKRIKRMIRTLKVYMKRNMVKITVTRILLAGQKK